MKPSSVVKISGYILLISLFLLIIIHLLVLIKLLPPEIVWGGNLTDYSSPRSDARRVASSALNCYGVPDKYSGS